MEVIFEQFVNSFDELEHQMLNTIKNLSILVGLSPKMGFKYATNCNKSQLASMNLAMITYNSDISECYMRQLPSILLQVATRAYLRADKNRRNQKRKDSNLRSNERNERDIAQDSRISKGSSNLSSSSESYKEKGERKEDTSNKSDAPKQENEEEEKRKKKVEKWDKNDKNKNDGSWSENEIENENENENENVSGASSHSFSSFNSFNHALNNLNSNPCDQGGSEHDDNVDDGAIGKTEEKSISGAGSSMPQTINRNMNDESQFEAQIQGLQSQDEPDEQGQQGAQTSQI